MARPRRPDTQWLDECFWPKVEKSSACWQWMGATTFGGYGVVNRDRLIQRTHRISWEQANGPIPTGLQVLHRCDNPGCVNPAHLFLGTATDNMQDKMAKGRGGYERRRRYIPGTAKLNPDLVSWLREARPRGRALDQVASDLGVSNVTIYNVLSGHTWRNVE